MQLFIVSNIVYVQRKTIPCILDGKDVVAMSRTGSGKTAAFVIPMLQRLKRRDTRGIRALLVSPTRELALQTFKVVKELGRYTGLRCAVLVGGDAIEDQFSTIHENPDILIATPGRLLHVVVEMDLRLSFAHYVVFDEADRLFEMGFQDQLAETLKRIPESRQTLLFSATLPKILVDFAKAGLSDPMLVRLDVDEKISDRLSMVFATCRADEKLAVLLHLCRQMNSEGKQTVVFCATMKHVEYVVGIMNRAGIDNSFIYSQLDTTARKLNIQKFAERKNNILIVTDVAARGVDIPLLDTVINLHFPPKAKLFVHRVGRVARAGRSGTAISLIAPDELPYLADLFLFLGKPMEFAQDNDKYNEQTTLIGRAPEDIVGLEFEFFNTIHDNNEEMVDLRQKATNAMMRYIRTRPPPSAESARRVKDELRIKVSECAGHPFLRLPGNTQRYNILNRLANYKTAATIFEVNVGNKSHSAAVMKKKRRQHQERIREMQEQKEKKKEALLDGHENDHDLGNSNVEQADDAAISEAFTKVIGRGLRGSAEDVEVKTSNRIDRAEERRREKARHFIAYSSADYQSEKHLALDKVDFARQADGATVEIFADDDKGMYKQKNAKRWDRKKKRFVGTSGDGPDNKKIRTEDGTWLPASYKTGRYEDWKKKQKLGYKKGYEDGDDQEANRSNENKTARYDKWKNHNRKQQTKFSRSEIRNVSQIRKIRRKSAKLQQYMEHRRQENLTKKADRPGGRKGGGGKRRK
ncbi:DEAD/DEAH box helicase [Necator americanus]|uniref:RNA helicase n=1 Tax=Necator americanus TaxID=51031 RepID=W2TMW0_NECAM|nr:DEAD/DEAH box helicase [Necator americanus]ETN83004.1 DEAD/DEAH box helicase [Necator americanus]